MFQPEIKNRLRHFRRLRTVRAFQKHQHSKFDLFRCRHTRRTLVRRKAGKPALRAKTVAGRRRACFAKHVVRQFSKLGFGRSAIFHRAAHAFDQGRSMSRRNVQSRHFYRSKRRVAGLSWPIQMPTVDQRDIRRHQLNRRNQKFVVIAERRLHTPFSARQTACRLARSNPCLLAKAKTAQRCVERAFA